MEIKELDANSLYRERVRSAEDIAEEMMPYFDKLFRWSLAIGGDEMEYLFTKKKEVADLAEYVEALHGMLGSSRYSYEGCVLPEKMDRAYYEKLSRICRLEDSYLIYADGMRLMSDRVNFFERRKGYRYHLIKKKVKDGEVVF